MHRISSLFALGVMLLAVLACSGNINTGGGGNTSGGHANNSNNSNSNSSPAAARDSEYVKEINLARDDGKGKPGETVTAFKTTDNPIYAIIILKEAKEGTKVKGEWIAVDAGGEKDSKFLEKDFTTSGKEDQVFMSAKLPRDWPTGDYRINVYINDKLDKTLDFKIK